MKLAIFFVIGVLASAGASAQSLFYVDPDYGGAPNGTAARPWTRLGSGEWGTINAQLALADVTVYFSAKEAGSQANDSYGGALVVLRSDSSSHRLTLDGMTLYNTNDTTPAWSANPGTYKMALTGGTEGIALGWHGGFPAESNITMRGFDISGSSARTKFGGDNLIVEFLNVHDVTSVDPAVSLAYAYLDGQGCSAPYWISHNVIIRNNTIARTIGEAIYIGGSNGETNGCRVNSHDTILIENNTITDAGINGAQGDGIDTKVGITHLTIRGNHISNGHNNNAGITMGGSFGGVTQSNLIEWNVVSGGDGNGILMGSAFGSELHGITIRYNTVTGAASGGISVTACNDANTLINHAFDVAIMYNTVANNRGAGGYPGLGAGCVDRLSVSNNLVFGNTGSYQVTVSYAVVLSGTAVIDYNLFAPNGGDSYANMLMGPHNEFRTTSAGLVVDTASPGWNRGPAPPTGVRILVSGNLTQ